METLARLQSKKMVDPLAETDCPTLYRAKLYYDAQCILRNAYNKFPLFTCRPKGDDFQLRWRRAKDALTYNSYLTETGFLTEKGLTYIQSHLREFTPHV